MKKLFSSIPVYLVENFHVISDENKEKYIKICLDNRKNLRNLGYNYLITDGDTKFFVQLYYKFYSLCESYFSFTKAKDNIDKVWSYSSNYEDYASIFHDHKNSCTITAVYYLNNPDKNSGDIEFLDNDRNVLTYHPNNFDLLIFPDYAVHKPNRTMSRDEWRISINMEIKSEEDSKEIFSSLTKV